MIMACRCFFPVVRFVFTCLILIMLVASPSSALANPKYAALVVDADTGSVLYAANANAERYPASLTKMMTLYLTFEALEQKILTLDTRLKVSQRAADMPQTNIGLKKGDTIQVRDIIRSLIVRSANDVAVVIAEALGGNEQRFAKKMTARARALGMKSTSFRNASGLPDKAQRSTARDLAVLSLALKKHFPQYFHFFRAKTFRYKGRTYKSHNKVMSRYPGADGIKTGYIRASGFNLATSARRHGRNIIAIVMGGKTSRRRDDHMIDLLDRSFAGLETKGHFAATRTLPVPKAKPSLPEAEQAIITALPTSNHRDEKAFEVLMSQLVAQHQEKNRNGMRQHNRTARGQFLAPSGVGQQEQDSTLVRPAYKGWGIQVGAFDQKQAAYTAVAQAMRVARPELSHSRTAVSDAPGTQIGSIIYRARLANLTKEQAHGACDVLQQRKASCFVFQVKHASDL